MIDRNIPYYNLILKCNKICTAPVLLPEGYSFKLYEVDDEKAEEIIEQCDDMFFENEEEINCKSETYAGTIQL